LQQPQPEQLLAKRVASYDHQKWTSSDIDFFSRFCCWSLSQAAHQNRTPRISKRKLRDTEAVKRDARAVAAGIREGWSRDKPLDLNAATKSNSAAFEA
jgi:hypothetical protein